MALSPRRSLIGARLADRGSLKSRLCGGDVIQFVSSIFADFDAVLAATTDNGNTLTIAAGADSIVLKVKDVSLLHVDDFALV
jgi:hypothetical protein